MDPSCPSIAPVYEFKAWVLFISLCSIKSSSRVIMRSQDSQDRSRPFGNCLYFADLNHAVVTMLNNAIVKTW